MEQIRSMFGSNVPEPIAYTRSQWGTDPYAKGCYSSAKVGKYMYIINILVSAREAESPTKTTKGKKENQSRNVLVLNRVNHDN